MVYCANLPFQSQLVFEDSLKIFDPLTGEVIREVPRITIYPKSHYVTGRERILQAIEFIKEELID